MVWRSVAEIFCSRRLNGKSVRGICDYRECCRLETTAGLRRLSLRILELEGGGTGGSEDDVGLEGRRGIGHV